MEPLRVKLINSQHTNVKTVRGETPQSHHHSHDAPSHSLLTNKDVPENLIIITKIGGVILMIIVSIVFCLHLPLTVSSFHGAVGKQGNINFPDNFILLCMKSNLFYSYSYFIFIQIIVFTAMG